MERDTTGASVGLGRPSKGFYASDLMVDVTNGQLEVYHLPSEMRINRSLTLRPDPQGDLAGQVRNRHRSRTR